METTFFTSDLHFGHTNILKYEDRPWDTVEEMNEGLIDNWNATVPPEGRTYVIGDFIMGKHAENLSIIKRLNGKKILIAGNHDKCWGGHKDFAKHKLKYVDAGIYWMADTTSAVFNSERVILCHFPKRATMTKYDTKFEKYHQTTDTTLLHGHVHSAWKVDAANKQINVGTDVWDFKPVSLEELESHWLLW